MNCEKKTCGTVFVSECGTWTSQTQTCERHFQISVTLAFSLPGVYTSSTGVYEEGCPEFHSLIRDVTIRGPHLLSNSSSLLISTSFQISIFLPASKQHHVSKSWRVNNPQNASSLTVDFSTISSAAFILEFLMKIQ
jgi:hypothetical protein